MKKDVLQHRSLVLLIALLAAGSINAVGRLARQVHEGLDFHTRRRITSVTGVPTEGRGAMLLSDGTGFFWDHLARRRPPGAPPEPPPPPVYEGDPPRPTAPEPEHQTRPGPRR